MTAPSPRVAAIVDAGPADFDRVRRLDAAAEALRDLANATRAAIVADGATTHDGAPDHDLIERARSRARLATAGAKRAIAETGL